MAKEKTMEEVREEFLQNIRDLVNYWDKVDDSTTKQKLEGLSFSILSMLDGCAGNSPAFIVAPLESLENIDFCKEENKDYYPFNSGDDIRADIAGSLHELFYKK